MLAAIVPDQTRTYFLSTTAKVVELSKTTWTWRIGSNATEQPDAKEPCIRHDPLSDLLKLPLFPIGEPTPAGLESQLVAGISPHQRNKCGRSDCGISLRDIWCGSRSLRQFQGERALEPSVERSIRSGVSRIEKLGN